MIEAIKMKISQESDDSRFAFFFPRRSWFFTIIGDIKDFLLEWLHEKKIRAGENWAQESESWLELYLWGTRSHRKRKFNDIRIQGGSNFLIIRLYQFQNFWSRAKPVILNQTEISSRQIDKNISPRNLISLALKLKLQ